MAHFCCMILHTLQCFDTDASSRYHFPAHRWRKTQTCALMPCLLWARPCQSWLPRSARRACPTTGRTTTSFCVSQRWCACGCLCACSCAGNWFGAEYGRCLLEKSAWYQAEIVKVDSKLPWKLFFFCLLFSNETWVFNQLIPSFLFLHIIYCP